jgi:stearoyl-CoA desaturase (delta-9 desaturase)
LRAACHEEIERLRPGRPAEASLLRSTLQWLHLDASQWSDAHRQDSAEVFAVSDRLRTLVEMREQLYAIWERSNATREQLVAQLQLWCAQAESSGIRALSDLSLRMRRYAPA